MELYLDSADLFEIEEAFKLGFLDGLTTTPTFMHRGGVTDLDNMILKLAMEYDLPLETEHMRQLYNAGTGVNKVLIVNREIRPNRITMIIVKEELGY